jgi:hypothetical protein
MADTDRARMLELGQWLQEFMNPGITAKGYRKMAHDFISFLTWKQRDKNQPKSTVKNQPPLMTDIPVRVRFKPDSKGLVFRPEQRPG